MSTDETIDELISQYYSLCDRQSIEMIRDQIFDKQKSLQEKVKIFSKYESTIEKLKPIFIDLVKTRNTLASESGEQNYFTLITNWDGVPEGSLNKLYRLESLKFKGEQDWFQTEFNNLDFVAIKSEFNIPEDVIESLSKKYPKLKKLLGRINFVHDTYRHYFTDYDKAKKDVTITYNEQDNSVDSAVELAHEFGHALTYLKLMDADKNPEKVKNYILEKEAIKTELNYITTLSPLQQKAVQYRYLYNYTRTLFEQSIYSNSHANFDKLFAQSHNKVYNGKQKQNPFYVLDTFLIEYPAYSANYSTVYFDLLTGKHLAI